MDHHQRALRTGAAALLLAISLRLFSGGIFQPLNLTVPTNLLTFLLYLQTGRIVRLPRPTQPPTPTQTVVSPTTEPPETQPPVVFTAEDLENIDVYYTVDYRPDLEALLLSPLTWLPEDAPTVLIVHTHATESYAGAPEEIYSEHGAYRSLDAQYNMLAIGEEVKRILETGGVRVIHDRTLHDYPSYNSSYGNARESIQRHLAENPEICMVLDIHRDASGGEGGAQLKTHGTVGGQPSSQLMVVIGTDASGNYHPNWRSNLALGLKLSAVLERADPGLTRPISLRSERFNMDMTPGSLLIEVGGAGDTHEEAMLAANALARGILALAKGTS
jgi:stage II sporulation protein P